MICLSKINHRGPDDNGIVELPGTNQYGVLGHVRLSIIDLDGGGQPMLSADNKFYMVFNGEIYNYQELQSELAAFYAEQGNWNGVNSVLRQSDAGPRGGGEGYYLRVANSAGQVEASRGAQSRNIEDFDLQMPIIVNGQRVGSLFAEPAGRRTRLRGVWHHPNGLRMRGPVRAYGQGNPQDREANGVPDKG